MKECFTLQRAGDNSTTNKRHNVVGAAILTVGKITLVRRLSVTNYIISVWLFFFNFLCLVSLFLYLSTAILNSSFVTHTVQRGKLLINRGSLTSTNSVINIISGRRFDRLDTWYKGTSETPIGKPNPVLNAPSAQRSEPNDKGCVFGHK